MSILTIEQVFGVGTTIDFNDLTVKIPLDGLSETLLSNATEANGLTLLAAIIKKAFPVISANIDETLNGGALLSVSSPSSRAGVDKTLFEYSFSFYAPYLAPILDPDDL